MSQHNVSPQVIDQLDIQFWIRVPDNAADWSDVDEIFCEDDSWWIRAYDAPIHAEKFVERYMAQEDGRFQGGFLIWTDGALWNEYAVDDLYMAMQWFQALEHLLSNPRQETKIWVWEMSELVLRRDDTALTMYETKWQKTGFCPPVTVNLYDLAQQMVAEGLEFAEWIRAIHREVSSRQPIETLRHLNEARRNTLLTTAQTATQEFTLPVSTKEEKLGIIIEQLPLSFIEAIERVNHNLHMTQSVMLKA